MSNLDPATPQPVEAYTTDPFAPAPDWPVLLTPPLAAWQALLTEGHARWEDPDHGTVEAEFPLV